MIGQTLGHYRILAKLGEGGMGEVYRAEDLTLKRQVALKLLPAEVTGSQEKIERFRREAETLASLDHPNIVTLYSIEHAEDHYFLTMQLVEGRLLSELIPEKGLAIRQAVEIGLALATALRIAHGRGVVHRDLKPANVMIDREGRVKVLDFGLAKLRRTRTDDDSSRLVTETMTREGMILGTIPYMSPEQIQGEPVDDRTDIFSLGVILHEMLCGQRPFQAGNSAALMSVILRDPPAPLDQIRPDVPEGLALVVERCLQKDPLLRYQSARDVWLELKEIERSAGGSGSVDIEAVVEQVLARVPSEQISGAPIRSGGETQPYTTRSASRERLAWWTVLAIAAALATAAYYAFFDRDDQPEAQPQLPAQLGHRQLTSRPGVEQYPTLSPDGEWVAYSATVTTQNDILLQSRGGQNAFNITEEPSADDRQPAFSPDGERIAFRSSRNGGGIFVMGRTGEAVRRVSREGFNPAWSPDGGKLVFATESVDLNPLNWQGPSQIAIVDLESGAREDLPVENAVQPTWSPDGRRIAYVARLGDPTRMDIACFDLHTATTSTLTSDEFTEWSPAWAPDGRYVYFASDRSGSMNLWRIAVEESSGKAKGDPQALTTPATYLAHVRLPERGDTIAYSSVLMTQNVLKLALDASGSADDGQPQWVTSGSTLWSSPDVSPDGEWLVFYSRTRPEGNLYLVRSDGSGLLQLTGDDAIDRVPRWSPDGHWITFFSDRSGTLQLWRIHRDGSDLQQLTDHPTGVSLAAWSPQADRIAVVVGLGSSAETIIIDPNVPWSQQDPEVIPPTEPAEDFFVVTSWSPDGNHLAGQIGYPGRGVMIYSLATRTYQRLTSFGEWPIWMPDSRRILFVSQGKEFFILDSSRGEPDKVYSVSRDVIGPPRISADGRSLFFSRRVTEADIWLLEPTGG